ncbi:o-succinylbenzoate synthase [Scytonema hofmannii PCC 7110]|uniref:o-succinylbenzoate synthase n=1 Tax=Scytonema hofmannii PCC 7110 TaxID=128403 RepID=A0A139X7F6_9CYAN|nr:o-succinylbenzoate synthase [Scytonema hofmannii]KYC40572.1 o-succinylbenzoate synthase [Scytonema hofmannii PCC 7110]
MHYQFQFRPYRRRFVRSLTTSHGVWDTREGIILKLTDDLGKVGWGEIAPISWFGSENLEQALLFCRQLPEIVTDETIFSIPDELPACQFGFESAVWGVGSREWRVGKHQGVGNEEAGEDNSTLSSLSLNPKSKIQNPKSLTYSALLPAGEEALEVWQTLWQQGDRTFKWKIGVYPVAEELRIFQRLAQTLPSLTKLRLDANGGLSYEEANLWLWTCDNVKANSTLTVEIEFIEQPLSVDKFDSMLELSYCYNTAIALDESVATFNQLKTCYQKGWRGIFVIKPGIVGSPSRLRQFCWECEVDAVFSSVFETSIGRKAALQLAVELSRHNRALGFGVNHFFAEEEEIWLKNLW